MCIRDSPYTDAFQPDSISEWSMSEEENTTYVFCLNNSVNQIDLYGLKTCPPGQHLHAGYMALCVAGRVSGTLGCAAVYTLCMLHCVEYGPGLGTICWFHCLDTYHGCIEEVNESYEDCVDSVPCVCN